MKRLRRPRKYRRTNLSHAPFDAAGSPSLSVRGLVASLKGCDRRIRESDRLSGLWVALRAVRDYYDGDEANAWVEAIEGLIMSERERRAA